MTSELPIDTTTSVVCSAPGKVILFGEHAVVYGTTAIAASLADCRMFCRITCIQEHYLDIHLLDFMESTTAQLKPFHITTESLSRLLHGHTDLNNPLVPKDDDLKMLKEEVKFSTAAIADGIYAICFLVANVFPELVWPNNNNRESSYKFNGFKIEIKSVQLPIGAGLGSSAAFSVALSGAFLRLKANSTNKLNYLFDDQTKAEFNTSPFNVPIAFTDLINKWAFAAETVIHGTPSGLDNTTSCYGGAVRFSRKDGMSFERLPDMPDLDILLTNTCVSRSTKVLVAKVRALHDSVPKVVIPILSSIENISQDFIEICNGRGSESTANLERIGSLFRVNHHLLCALGVGHISLEAVYNASSQVGLACKLTGAGGGGCAITLLNNSSREDENLVKLREELIRLGYVSFFSVVGGAGVKWHDEFPSV